MKKLLLCLLMLPAMARAEFYTGNDLYMKMTNSTSNSLDAVVAMGYVVGVYDVGVHLFFCPPKPETGITVGQINDIAKNWLAANAGRRNELAHKLVIEAFKQVWPCANRTNRNPV